MTLEIFCCLCLNIGSSQCQDTNKGATNKRKEGCEAYEGDDQALCGETFDDDDFKSNTMCCSCKNCN